MISAKTFQRYTDDPASFRNDLIVDVDGVARKFGEVMDEWQREDFAALDPALMRCNGRSLSPATMRHYRERGRGHSKTTDLALTCVYAMAFAARPLKGYCYAADTDQAALLKNAVQTLLRLNPWLASILTVGEHRVTNTAKGHPGAGGTLEIEASDVGSSYGILPDIIIADELVHWAGDGSLFHSLISSAAKRSNCLLVVISNAGFVDSWAWKVREIARTDPAWHFSRIDGCLASWITPERLAEQRRMLPSIAFARLWLNQWSSGGGDALTEEDIKLAFMEGLSPMSGRETGYQFVGGVDLGLKRDCSAVVVLGIPSGGRAGRIRLAHHRLWKPTLGNKINLSDVERHILEMDKQYELECCAFDPWNCELLAQRCEALTAHRRRTARTVSRHNRPWMREIPPTAGNLREQATLTIESFNDRRLQLYPCEPLKRDLLKLRVEEKSYGVRLTSPKNEQGHGDTFSAFSLALLVGHELSSKRPSVAGAAGTDRDPMQRTMDRLEELNDYEQRIAQGGSDRSGTEQWRALMRLCGR